MERGVERLQLPIRQGMEKAFEEDNGFAKAGIEVVMGGVEEVPFAFRMDGRRVVQLFRRAGE